MVDDEENYYDEEDERPSINESFTTSSAFKTSIFSKSMMSKVTKKTTS